MNLSILTVFLKNRNFISKIRRSKVTDYAALIHIRIKGGAGNVTCLNLPLFFSDRYKGMLLTWIIVLFVRRVCLCNTVWYVPCNHEITCWEIAGLFVLVCVMFCNVFSVSHNVSRVRCGT